jgi:hypothetical protein
MKQIAAVLLVAVSAVMAAPRAQSAAARRQVRSDSFDHG